MTEESKLPALFVGNVEEDVPAHALARYQDSKAVAIVAKRVQETDHGKIPIKWTEALLVSQAALTTGLSPFQPRPEIWFWISEYQGKRRLTIMRARDGEYRMAEEAAKREGTYLEPDRWRVIIEETEKAKLGFKAGDLVVEVKVPNHRDTTTYYQHRIQLKDEGLSSDEIDERVGKHPPADVGYGVMTASDIAKKDQDGSSRTYPHINRTRKRGRVEAVKQRWSNQIDYSRLVEGASQNLDDYAIDAEWREVDTSATPTPEELEKTAGNADALYGDGAGDNIRSKAKTARKRPNMPDKNKPSYWSDDVIEAILEANLADTNFEAAGMLAHSEFDKSVAKTPALTFARAYRAARDEGDDSKTAGEKGMAKYLEGLKKRREK